MRISCSLLVVLLLSASPARAARWPQAYLVDGRLAALRTAPELTALVRKRLRAGRAVAIVERRRDRDGLVWVRVAVTRRTRGWLLEDALARPGDRDGERRLSELIATSTGFTRIQLARLALDRFPRLREAAAAAIDEEARAAAVRLSQSVIKRLGPLSPASPAQVRTLMLTDPALDRYSRLGVAFDVDVERMVYVPRLRSRPE